jgi:hypothetical protein
MIASTEFNAALFNAALFSGTGAGGECPVLQVGHDLLYPALRKAGITIGPGRTPSPAQFQDAIEELNRLISSLNCDRLFIYSLDVMQIPITGSGAAVTIGCDPTGSIEVDLHLTQRPPVISFAVLIQNGIRYPVTVATPQVWASRTQETFPNSFPTMLYYDCGYPVATVTFDGQPQAGSTLELWTWHLIPRAQSLGDALQVPAGGYDDALVLNLAVRLAPHFQRPLDPNVREDARISLMRLMSINAPQPIADLSAGLGCGGNRYNVYSDETR